MKSPFSAYKDIISCFVEKNLSARQFEKKFMQLFKYDKSCIGETYEVLSPLFWAVEDFCSYPELRDEDDIDEHQLMEVAKDTLKKINELEGTDETDELTDVLRNLLKEILPDVLRQIISEEKSVLEEIKIRKH